jgi:chloride channel protein, CIC family
VRERIGVSPGGGGVITTAALSRPLTSSRSSIVWYAAAAWAIGLGFIGGLSCVGVRFGFRMLQWLFVQHTGTLPAAAAALSPGRRAVTPVLGALLATAVVWVVRRWSLGGRFEEYVEAVRLRGGHIPFRATFWRTVSSAFSIATGAAIGREGSMIQFATAVAAWVAERFPLGSAALSRQVSYGAAAAVAAAYQAPIAGVFFAAEIVIGEWRWAELPHLALASAVGWLASRELLGAGPLFAVSSNFTLSKQELWALPLAVALGVAAPAYQALLRSLRFACGWPLALVWSGLMVGALSLLQPAVWGNGDAALTETLQAAAAPLSIVSILMFRLLATTLCVGTGTVGGVFTPTLFAGAAVGLAAGHFLGIGEPVLLAVAGLSALLAGVTHAPLMAAFMAVELTGKWDLWPVLLVLNLVAYFIARAISPRSLYAIATPTPGD